MQCDQAESFPLNSEIPETFKHKTVCTKFSGFPKIPHTIYDIRPHPHHEPQNSSFLDRCLRQTDWDRYRDRAVREHLPIPTQHTCKSEKDKLASYMI